MQLVAREAAELLFAGEHGGHLVLARQQRQLDVPQFLPGASGTKSALIRCEVGDALAQPVQGRVMWRTSQMPKARQASSRVSRSTG